MFYLHILTTRDRNINSKNKTYIVLTAGQEKAMTEEGLLVQNHVYKIQCGRVEIHVHCPKIHDQENEERYFIQPEFLVAGRPYPIYVYLYVIAVYCLNPEMGQREASERTRIRFGLATFSHSTLCRALKTLEKHIKEQKEEKQNERMPSQTMPAHRKSFPTVGQTRDRRDMIASYLKEAAGGSEPFDQEAEELCERPVYKRLPYAGAFIDACHRVVEYTFLAKRRILL